MNISEHEELEFYRSLLKTAHGFMYTLNMDPHQVEWVSKSPIVHQYSGYTPEQVMKQGAFAPGKLPEEPDFQESIVDAIEAFKKDPDCKWGGVFRYLHKDGSKKWVAYTSSTLEKNKKGETSKITCIGIPLDSFFNTPESLKEAIAYSSKKLYAEEIKSLTNRQMQVLAMISKGMLRKEIASNLQLSITTIDSHKKCLFKKFNCTKLSELSMIAQKMGITYPYK